MEKIENSKPGCLLDTGPIVALLSKNHKNHNAIKQQCASLKTPFKTCEAVLSEAVFVLKRDGVDAETVFRLGHQGFYTIDFQMIKHINEIHSLFSKYKNIPASLADACLIRCAEIHNEPRILTLDSDFKIYRWGKNKKFQVLN